MSLSSTNIAAYNNLAASDMSLNQVYISLAKSDSETLSASFHPNTDDNVSSSINGMFRGSFIPYESTTDPVTAKYKVRVVNESFFDADISFGIVGRSVAVSGDNQKSPNQLIPRVIIQNDFNTGEETISTGTINAFSLSSQTLTGEPFCNCSSTRKWKRYC